MKAILISDRPKWCALMMNGKKKLEVRKGTALYKATQKLIDEYGYADIYVYCTKAHDFKDEIYLEDFVDKPISNLLGKTRLNGKVIFKFRCYNVEEIYYGGKYNQFDPYTACYYTDRLIPIYLKHRSCLEYDELGKYLNGYERLKGKRGAVGTAIHISDLEIFDKPKELWEISGIRPSGLTYRLTKAPQSWCYVEV